MNVEDLANDLKLTDLDKNALKDFTAALKNVDALTLNEQAHRILHSSEMNDPALGRQKLMQAMLVSTYATIEGGMGMTPDDDTGTKISTLPAGARDLSDLVDPAGAHKSMDRVKTQIKTLEGAGHTADTSPELAELKLNEADITANLIEIGAARDKLIAHDENIKIERSEQDNKRHAEARAEMVRRKTGSFQRMQNTPEKAAELAEKDTAAWYERHPDGF